MRVFRTQTIKKGAFLMQKSKYSFSRWGGVLKSKTQSLSVAFGTSLSMLMPIVASADVGDVAKSTGTDVAKFLFIGLIIVGGISLLVAGIMMSSGSQRLHEKGQSRLLKTLIGIVVGCLTGMIITWIYGVITSAGGGNFITWPF